MIALNLSKLATRPLHLPAVKAFVASRDKLIARIFENMDASRKEHNERSEKASRKHYEDIADYIRQLKKLEFLVQISCRLSH